MTTKWGYSVSKFIGVRFLVLIALLSPISSSAFLLSYGNTGAATGDHTNYIRELVRRFKIAHPKASVEVRGTESYLKPVVETLMYQGSDDIPDVAIVSLSEWPVIVSKGLLNEVSVFVSEKELQKIRQNLRAERNVMYYGSEFDFSKFHLPMHRSQPILFLNHALLPVKKSYLKWADLETLLKSARAGAAKSGNVENFRILIPTEDWTVEQLMLDARGRPTLERREAHFNDESTREIMAEVRKLRDLGVVEFVPTHTAAYSQFVEGRAAGAILSFSSYNSVTRHAQFRVHSIMPPTLGKKLLVSGGGDLLLPKRPNQTAEARRDIRTFLLWFYLEGGDGEWCEIVGYPPITQTGLASAGYRRQLKGRAGDLALYANSAGYKFSSFYRLDDRCNIGPIHDGVKQAFVQGLNSTDLSRTLTEADHSLQELLNQKCPSPSSSAAEKK